MPVSSLGNWIPLVLYSWGCVSRSCGLAQAVFSSDGRQAPSPDPEPRDPRRDVFAPVEEDGDLSDPRAVTL